MSQKIEKQDGNSCPSMEKLNLTIKAIQELEISEFLPRFDVIQEGLEELDEFETVHATRLNVLALDREISSGMA